KRHSVDTINKDSAKKMKKVHITRSKGERSPTLLQTTTLEEIIEHEAAAENQQTQLETNDFCEENSTAMDIEDAETSIKGKIENKTHLQETKSWSGLFTKLTKGRATYSTFSTRANISTKIRNALLFDIQKLNQISTNDIVATLYGKMGGDFIGAKPHFVKGTRMYLEIIFTDEQRMKDYSKKGMDMFQQTFYGYISSRTNQDLLSVRLRRVPIMDKEIISEKIRWVFDSVGTIMAIKPLLYKGTPIQSDQWVIIFDVTEDTNLTERIPRYVNIMDQKVVTEWKEAPKLCFFCDGEGHMKRDCDQLKEANKLNQHYKEFKALKNKQTRRDEVLEPDRETVEERTGNSYVNKSQNNESQEVAVTEQDVHIAVAEATLETVTTQSNIHNEEIVTPDNLEPSTAASMAANKGNIALAGPIRNEERNNKNNNNMLLEPQSLLNDETANITQPEMDDGFTE
ncbi:5989_t:CDS:2, partial [Racocetra fulgida]